METRRNSFQEEVDPEDPDEDAVRARVEREHMLELYSGDHPELKLAFEDWVRTSRLLEERVKHGTEVGRLAKREICHLAGVFVVVEGVLLSTLSQVQLLTCGSWWISFHLSFLASAMVLIPLVQRVTTYWCARVRVRSLLLALEVLSRRIHVMKMLGPLESTFDEKVVTHELLKKPGPSSTVLRMTVVTTTILAVVFLLILGVHVRCEGSMKMQQRLRVYSDSLRMIDNGANFQPRD